MRRLRNKEYTKTIATTLAIAICLFAAGCRKEEPVDHAAQGLIFAARGEYDKAISEFTRALEADSSEIVYSNRGLAYYHKGEYDRAISDHSKAIELNPRYAEACYNRGNAYAGKGEFDRPSQTSVRLLRSTQCLPMPITTLESPMSVRANNTRRFQTTPKRLR